MMEFHLMSQKDMINARDNFLIYIHNSYKFIVPFPLQLTVYQYPLPTSAVGLGFRSFWESQHITSNK